MEINSEVLMKQLEISKSINKFIFKKINQQNGIQ